MYRFAVGYHSDRGTTHAVNQDSIVIKSFSNAEKRVLVAGLFDGMGGGCEGERVSGAAAQAVGSWACSVRTLLLQDKYKTVGESLVLELRRINENILQYSRRAGIEAGTTAAVFVLWPDRYLCCNIGDSRIYRISESEVALLTEDHSLVAGLVRAGLLSEMQAREHPQRNVLTQAIGVLELITPTLRFGQYQHTDSFLLCCDGFYRELADSELWKLYTAEAQTEKITELLVQLRDLAISRGESDNITGIAIKTISEG